MATPQNWSARQRYLLSIGGVVVITLLLTRLTPLHETNIALIYLLVVLISATTVGLVPAILASVLAFLAFNFFFVPPLHTLVVATPEDFVRLLTFLAVAVVTSTLASRARAQADTAQRSADELASLYGLSQALSAEVTLERVLPLLAETTVRLVNVPMCSVLIYDENGFLAERTVAGTPPPPPTRTLDTFLRAGPRVLGVLRVAQRSMREELSATEQKRLETIAAQLVLVLERAQLAEEAARMRAQAEAERVKGALLSSVSHDLRTPLAVIKGAVTNLLDESVAWDVATRHELLNAVDTETDRLNRLVGNLLEMSRIESGALHPARDWHDIAELLADVAERMRARFTEHSVTLSAPPDLPLVQISYTQIDQVLTNLLENAQKYTPPGTPIELCAELADDAIRITVRDYGPGIPAGMHSRIFEKFVRAAAPERHADGTGLGLAICKGIIEAHGGQIWAEAAPGGGAAFVFTLPLPPDEQPTSALDLAEAEVASSV